ncbi:AMP-binding protein [Phaeodactylibacter sp.]|uniref:AMP-binding protein n=1 Tax=Phaeodactylibacter sp. TaxID=1940289 RepID=UPI0025D0CE17|nr:AMP-binding protein [Phaeodactylibacter sp.]MCI4650376.1 AMP-binding protein [Phaeodactylibacter sp.]MCI5094519.1 AMP-binding protein [Phaeodactylibacter sp.]
MENLVDLLQRRVQEAPDFTPFIFLRDGVSDEQSLSHRLFDEQARRVAAHLQEHGLKGERLLLLFPQGIEYLIALFGCFYAGVIAVPAYPPRNNRNLLRLKAIMQDCGARFILADQKGVEYMEGMKEDFSAYTFLPIEGLMGTSAEWVPHQPDLEGIAYLQYTSGSTGDPKGVIIRHENVMANIIGCMQTHIPDLSKSVSWIPMYHDMGLISMLTYLFQGGVECYFMSPVHFIQKPVRWLAAVSRYQAEFTLGPNFAFDLCCEKITDEQLEGLDLSSIRSVVSGSERVRWRTIQAFCERFGPVGFPKTGFLPSFGLAEATLIVTTSAIDQKAKVHYPEAGQSLLSWDDGALQGANPEQVQVSNGKPVDGAGVVIVDTGTRALCPEGKEGEIWAGYPGSIASGYWERPEESKKTFENYTASGEGPYLRTGDLGFLVNGELFITGREKDLIIIRGTNYYPDDIEEVVEHAHPALQDNGCAAFAIEKAGRERLVLVQEVRRTEWRNANEQEVVDAIRQAVSEVFEIQPHAIVLIRPMSLPKTSSGKVQRYAAREDYQNGALRIMHKWAQPETIVTEAAPIPEPGTAGFGVPAIVEWLKLQIAEKVKMPMEQIKAADPVKAYPLESVDAVFISDELSDWLKLRLTPDTFWAFDSIQELAEHLLKQYQENHD